MFSPSVPLVVPYSLKNVFVASSISASRKGKKRRFVNTVLVVFENI